MRPGGSGRVARGSKRHRPPINRADVYRSAPCVGINTALRRPPSLRFLFVLRVTERVLDLPFDPRVSSPPERVSVTDLVVGAREQTCHLRSGQRELDCDRHVVLCCPADHRSREADLGPRCGGRFHQACDCRACVAGATLPVGDRHQSLTGPPATTYTPVHTSTHQSAATAQIAAGLRRVSHRDVLSRRLARRERFRDGSP
jgi:hypothetical protein